MHQTIAHLIAWYQSTLDSMGYLGVAVLMAMESTIIPLPSELVIPFAAQRAHTTGSLSVTGVIIAGALGSWIGATIMYWVSRLAGRPVALRYGRYFLVPEAKIHAAEAWASHFGSAGVLVARLLPVVRHLIGIPMGIVKMDFRIYSIFTFVGSLAWCSVLAWVGMVAGNDEKLLQGDLRRITIWLVGAAVVLGLIYYFLVHRFFTKRENS
jgi:membrane protein DedA with SNARE-associated domain